MQKQPLSGFTLIELLFVLAIGIIIVTVGVPSFSNLVKSGRLTASVNDVVTSIQLTRSEASKRGVAITLCPSDDTTAAEPSCSGTGGWEEGYIAFVDDDANGSRDAGEELVTVHGRFGRGVFVMASAELSDGITYGGDGFPTGLANASSNLVFCDDPNDDRRTRVLNISSTGRPMTVRDGTIPPGLQCSG